MLKKEEKKVGIISKLNWNIYDNLHKYYKLTTSQNMNIADLL